MALDRWTREQELAVLYAKLEYGQQFRTHPDIERLATAIGRTEAAVVKRKANFDSLDPSVHNKGLIRAAQQTKDVWAEYGCNPDQVFAEAREAYQKLLNSA